MSERREVLTTTSDGMPVLKGRCVRFHTIERHRYAKTYRNVKIEHLGKILDLTKSGLGVVLEGVDVRGVFSRRFEEIPELRGGELNEHI